MDIEEKNRYDTEAMARTMGREYARRNGVELFVYREAECLGWFLTKTERADYWNVKHHFTQSDDFSDVTSDPFFWDRLAGMPDGEADMMLRTLRRQCIDHIEHFDLTDSKFAYRLRAVIRRVNDEIHFLSQRAGTKAWADAIRQIYGDEGLDQVRVLMLHMREEVALKSKNVERATQLRAQIQKVSS